MANQHCPSCDLMLQKPEYLYCTHCSAAVRAPTADERPDTVRTGSWKPPQHLFAERISPESLSAWFSKGVNVDASQTGLLLHNGEIVGELPPGRHILERLDQRLRKFITGEAAAAVLLRRGVFPLILTGTSADQSGARLTYSCEIGIRCEDYRRFYIDLMQSQDCIVSGQILQKLGPQFRHTVSSRTASREASSLLTPHPELTTRLTDELADAMEETAGRYGLVVAYISPLVFSEGADAREFRKQRSEYLRELRSEKLDVELERQRQKIEAERYVLTRAARDAAKDEEIENLERDEHREILRREIQFRLGANKLDLDDQLTAKADSVQQLARARREDNEDHDNERAHVLAMFEVRRKLELSDRSFQLKLQLAQQDIELSTVEREARIRAAVDEQRSELNALQAGEEARLARWTLQEDSRRSHLLKDAETQAGIETILRESKREKHKLQMQKAADILELEERVDANEDARLAAEQERRERDQQADFQREEARRKAEHERTLQMSETSRLTQLLNTLNTNPDNPLIAQTLAPLLQAEMTKGMSFEQILAQHGTNPEAARTLRAYVQSQASTPTAATENAQQLAVINQILSQLEASHTASREQMQQYMADLKEIHLHNAGLFRDIAVANANNAAAPRESADVTDDVPTSAELVNLLKDLQKRLRNPNRDY